jgi:uncharacterized protein (UPF0332 family)
MAYNPKKNEYASSLINEAIRLEQDAEDLRKKHGANGKRIGDKYEEAGDLRKKARDFLGAHTDYRNAKIYGFSHNEEKVKNLDKKIKLLLLERKTKSSKLFLAFLSIASLVSALFFVSFSFTGNVIFGLAETDSRWAGLCLFLCGLVFTFLYFRKK